MNIKKTKKIVLGLSAFLLISILFVGQVLAINVATVLDHVSMMKFFGVTTSRSESYTDIYYRNGFTRSSDTTRIMDGYMEYIDIQYEYHTY